MRTIPLFGSKNKLSAIRSRDTNLLVRALNSLLNMTVARGNANAFTYADGNIVLTLKNLEDATDESGISPVYVFLYRYKSMEANHIVCRTWDGTTEGSTDINIAKPKKLRNDVTSATIDGVGVTYTYDATYVGRTATIAAVNELQIIVPRYVPDDLIFGVAPTGGTGLAGKTIQDLNVDARAWAKKN